jgi:DNA-binding protein H-NS
MATLQELIAQRESLDREIEAAKKQGRADAIARIHAIMNENGLSISDITGKPAKGGSGKKAPIKYRHGATGETWSGRGLQPRWLREALAGGARIEDFAV